MEESREYENMPQPNIMLVWAILVTIFCFLPFGIPAIVYAAKVNSLWATNRKQEAYDAAKSARTWVIVSAIVGFVCNVGAYIYLLTLGVFASLI